MAVKIRLDCRKAFERLQDTGYKFHVPNKSVKIYVPDGTHINVYGKTLAMRTLVSLMVHGNPANGTPPRPFVTDAGRVLNNQLRDIMVNNSYIRKQNNKSPNYLGDIYIDFDADALCTQATALIRDWLIGGYYCAIVPNAPKTIQNKGFNLPLVETGQLVNSISAKVVYGKGAY